jgi:5-methylcytosine-specific restriction endonuclease McrA
MCKAHYNRARRARFGWRALAGDPEKIRQKDRMKTRRRRAKVNDPGAEDIYIDVVGDRDGWRCGIPACGRKVDKVKRHPHPLSPSIDHIEPLSKGGLHTYANVRIAHLRCNIARSNRFDYEQLALVG